MTHIDDSLVGISRLSARLQHYSLWLLVRGFVARLKSGLGGQQAAAVRWEGATTYRAAATNYRGGSCLKITWARLELECVVLFAGCLTLIIIIAKT